MVGNFDTLTERTDTNVASNFRRLTDPGQLVCCVPEKIQDRLVRETRSKEHFEFIHTELAEAQGVTPTPMVRFVIALYDRDMIADHELCEGAVFPI